MARPVFCQTDGLPGCLRIRSLTFQTLGFSIFPPSLQLRLSRPWKRGKCLRTPEVHHLSTRRQQRSTGEIAPKTGAELASHVHLPFQEPDLGGSWSQPIIGHRGMLCTNQGKLPLFSVEHDVASDICVDFSLYPRKSHTWYCRGVGGRWT